MASIGEDDDEQELADEYRADLDALIETFGLNAIDAEAELEAEIAFLEAQGQGE